MPISGFSAMANSVEEVALFYRPPYAKGKFFDSFTQSDAILLVCHINSLTRKKLNDRSSIAAFSLFHGDTILRK